MSMFQNPAKIRDDQFSLVTIKWGKYLTGERRQKYIALGLVDGGLAAALLLAAILVMMVGAPTIEQAKSRLLLLAEVFLGLYVVRVVYAVATHRTFLQLLRQERIHRSKGSNAAELHSLARELQHKDGIGGK